MKRSVLLIQQTIPHYRVPIFNLLAEQVDLTVVYEYGAELQDAVFAAKKVETFHIPRVGKYYRGGLKKLTAGYDVVINSYDTPAYAVRRLGRLKRRGFGLLHWGIGVSASYTSAYDAGDANRAYYESILRESDACLFYSAYPAEKYAKLGWPKETLFVAPNTVRVARDETPCERDCLLFLGSLYPQKGFDELLGQYLRAYRQNPDVPKLVIIGDGCEKGRVEEWIVEQGVQERILLTGAIYDDAALGQYFARAIACVSPKQAGLTVLKSMGCGVAYVTRKDAITGGERFNIENGVNGVLYDEPDQLGEIMLDLTENKEKYLAYGANARAFYEACRKPADMVEGFLAAIEYAAAKARKRSGGQ
jgi:glycosyltransferase involved in cell wall biosynthesis